MYTMQNRAIQEAKEQYKVKGFGPQEVDCMVEIFDQSPSAHPHLQIKNHLDSIVDGTYCAIKWPWPALAKLSTTLLPGSVVVFAGSPGASKSFAMLQCVSFWTKKLVQCSIMCLEGDLKTHFLRLLAQMMEECEITNLEWVRDHPIEVQSAYEQQCNIFDELGQTIYTASSDDMNYYDVLDFINDRGYRGDRIVIIDPITAADAGEKQWEGDRRVVIGAHKLARKYGMSVIFVSHPVKGHLGPSLDSLAGGTAFQRHVDGVLWLEALESKSVTVAGACGRSETEIDRVMYLLKVKDGPGQGKRIGFRFDVQSLSLAEQGLILKNTS